jgi:uncharacterized protein
MKTETDRPFNPTTGTRWPASAVTQKFGLLGRSGSGKTFGAGRMAEEFLDAGVQIVAVDPVGTWYGLRLDSDGESPGIKIPVFGGIHGDIPLEPTAGKLVADLIVDHGVSLVLDVSEFTYADQRRFVTDFATHLLARKRSARSPMMIFWDECQEFVPQDVRGDKAKVVGAMERLVKMGRNFGVGTTLISQRPQAVNKDVLNQTECLICFQLTGPHERKAVQGWVVEKGIDTHLVDELPALEVGHAFLWSPGWLQTLERVKFRRKRTFDASSTPEFGKAEKSRQLAPIDLAKVQEAMKATIERAKESDPALLREQLRKAQAELKRAQAQPGAPRVVEKPVERVVEKQVLDTNTRKAIVALTGHLQDVKGAAEDQATTWKEALAAVERVARGLQGIVGSVDRQPAPRATRPAPEPARPVARPPTNREIVGSNGDLGRGPRALLRAIASRHPTRLSRVQVSTLSGYSQHSSTFANYLSELNTSSYIERYEDGYGITDAGFAALGADVPDVPASRKEVLALWQSKLVGRAKEMLRILADVDGGMTREDLAYAVAMSVNSSSFANYLSSINSNGLIVKRNKKILINPEVFG